MELLYDVCITRDLVIVSELCDQCAHACTYIQMYTVYTSLGINNSHIFRRSDGIHHHKIIYHHGLFTFQKSVSLYYCIF